LKLSYNQQTIQTNIIKTIKHRQAQARLCDFWLPFNLNLDEFGYVPILGKNSPKNEMSGSLTAWNTKFRPKNSQKTKDGVSAFARVE